MNIAELKDQVTQLSLSGMAEIVETINQALKNLQITVDFEDTEIEDGVNNCALVNALSNAQMLEINLLSLANQIPGNL